MPQVKLEVCNASLGCPKGDIKIFFRQDYRMNRIFYFPVAPGCLYKSFGLKVYRGIKGLVIHRSMEGFQ